MIGSVRRVKQTNLLGLVCLAPAKSRDKRLYAQLQAFNNALTALIKAATSLKTSRVFTHFYKYITLLASC